MPKTAVKIVAGSGLAPETITPPIPRMAYSMRESAEALGISYISIQRLTKRGLLKTSGALRNKLIPVTEIERFLAESTK